MMKLVSNFFFFMVCSFFMKQTLCTCRFSMVFCIWTKI
ncbi:unnamed protein product [Brassica oleracea var. botrytis]